MGRNSFSSEIDDFVKSFQAGSEMVRKNRYAAIAEAEEARAAKKAAKIDADDAEDKAIIEGGGKSATFPEVKGNVTTNGDKGANATGQWWTPERMKYAADYLEKNAGLSKYGAAGLVARWSGVEAPGGPTSLNQQNKKAFGIAQWLTNDRLNPIKGNTDFDAQLKHAAWELNNSEGAAAKALRAAKSEGDGARGAAMYERAEGWNPKTGTDNFVGKTPVASVYKTIYGASTAAAPAQAVPTNNTPAPVAGAPQVPAITKDAGTTPIGRSAAINIPESQETAMSEPDMDADDYSLYSARGGMVRRYADGGMVEGGETDPVTSFLDGLPAAIKGGLEGLQDMFGLNQAQAGAIPQANGDFMSGVKALFSGEGALPPEQVKQVEQTVDPENRLDSSMRRIAGLTAAYEHWVEKGDMDRARISAARLLQSSFLHSQRLGAVAQEALNHGDQGQAAKALLAAYNTIPDGKHAEIQDGKLIITDQKTGQAVQQMEVTPQLLLQAANGFTNGDQFHKQLVAVASGKFDASATTGISEDEEARRYADADEKGHAVDTHGMNANQIKAAVEYNRNYRQGVSIKSKEAMTERRINAAYDLKKLVLDATSGENDKKIAAREKLKQMGIDANVMLKKMGIDATATENDKKIAAAERLKQLAIDATSDENDKKIAARRELAELGFENAESLLETKQTFQGEQKDKDRASREGIAADNRDASAAKQAIDLNARNERQDKSLGVRQSEGAANRASREGIAADNRDASAAKQAIDLNARSDRQDKSLGVRQSEGAANRASREGIAADNRDANAANTAVKLDADVRKREEGNAEFDRRTGRKALLTRQGSQMKSIDKMTDHAILGVDETTTPKVSAGQAQATRNIARGILEGAGGKIAGDEAASYARQMTKWDPVAKRPKVQVKLNKTKDGYSATMPDGVTVPLSESAFNEVARIHGGAQ